MAVARGLRFPLAVLFVYAYLFPWLPGLRSPNELSRLYQARAIVEDRALSVNAQLARHGPVGDLSVKDGRYYPNKAPGVSFLGAGVYAVARGVNGGRELGEAAAVYWLRLVCCMVPGAIAAELLRRVLARRFEPGLALAGAAVFALGTLMWPYSTLLMSHGPTAAAVVGCWWAVEKALSARRARGQAAAARTGREEVTVPGPGAPERSPGATGVRDEATRLGVDLARRARSGSGWWLLAGFLAGWAVLLEYTSAIALVPLVVYALARREPPFASPMEPGAEPRRLSRGERESRERATATGDHPRRSALARDLLSRAVPAVLGALPPLLALALYHQAAFGSPLATGYRYLVNPQFTAWHARGYMGVGAPSVRALAGSFLDPARGLFVWCPWLALGVPGLWLLAGRDRAIALLCAAELALYALFTASFTYEAWGWSVGPRHITTVCAFLVPPALAAAAWLRERGLGWVAAGLAVTSIALVGIAVAVCPYLPEELTNPVHQLVVPLARAGMRSRDVLGVALGSGSAWTLLPWAAVLVVLTWASVRALSVPTLPSSRGGQDRLSGGPRLLEIALALAVGAALLLLHSALGEHDRFSATRAFMSAQFREAGR